MTIEIIDVNGTKIRGCCKVEYKGYDISISNVWPVSSDRIMVMRDDRFLHGCFTLEEAVNWIDDAARFDR